MRGGLNGWSWQNEIKRGSTPGPTGLARVTNSPLPGQIPSGNIPSVLDLAPFQNLTLRGGFVLVETQLTAQPLLDPIERAADALTVIRGTRFHIYLRAEMMNASCRFPCITKSWRPRRWRR
jgi:hypothetical protein